MDIRRQALELITGVKDDKKPLSELRAFLQENADELAAQPVSFTEPFVRALRDVRDLSASRNRQDQAWLDHQHSIVDVVKAARLQGEADGLARAIREGVGSQTAIQAPAPSPQPAPEPEGRADPWPDLVPEFYKDRPDFAPKTLVGYATTFRHLEEVIGRKLIKEITRGDVKSLADFLRDKPSARSKTGTLKRNTILRQVTEAKVFLRWACDCGYLANRGFDEVKIRGATQEEKRQLPEEIRRAFAPDELKRLFSSPLFTGYKSPTRRATPGPMTFRGADAWFIIIMAHTGARPQEIAEAPAVLKYLDDIPCLDLVDAGSKTPNARRLIPIIPDLRRLGFLDYVARQAKAGRTLVQDGKTKRTPDAWSKRLNRYIDDIGLTDDALVAYSLRHSFRQMLRSANLNHETVNRVFGHETGEVGAGYGKQLSVGEARQVVGKVKFPISLGHLMTTSRNLTRL
jgi:integrase